MSRNGILVSAVALILTACSSHDLYDPEKVENLTKESYSENFVKAYPNVNLNRSWDLSHKQTAYMLPSSTSSQHAATRAQSYTVTPGEAYEVDNSTLQWLKNKLVEQRNNSALGSPFYMKVPDNGFTIVPIYQGRANLIWELHAVIDGVDVKVWEKSQDLWLKTKANQTDWTRVYDITNDELYRCTLNATSVKATTYTFNNLPAGADMYFYLLVTSCKQGKEKEYKDFIGRQQSSLNGMMLALKDCPRPANIDEDNEVMIIGCEDVDTKKSDWDMNDVVFMVYGKPYVPQPLTIEEGTPITKKTTVRYLIEDLGSTDDFDFNDIVIDVSDVWTSTPKYTNGILTSWTDTDFHQEAVIRHLGGTLPFILKIGDTELPEMQGELDVDVNQVFPVTGWDKDAHNIGVKVRSAQSKTIYNNVVFPKAGEAPMILAVDPTVEWMEERSCVPESWFYIPE